MATLKQRMGKGCRGQECAFNLSTDLDSLGMKPTLYLQLLRLGYVVAGDMLYLSKGDILKIPGTGGSAYQRISPALGRKLYVLGSSRSPSVNDGTFSKAKHVL